MKYRKIEINVPVYEGDWFRTDWLDNYVIQTTKTEDDFLIKANNDGLVTLATHLLALAQPEVSNHIHIHYDPECGLEKESFPLIIEKDDTLK